MSTTSQFNKHKFLMLLVEFQIESTQLLANIDHTKVNNKRMLFHYYFFTLWHGPYYVSMNAFFWAMNTENRQLFLAVLKWLPLIFFDCTLANHEWLLFRLKYRWLTVKRVRVCALHLYSYLFFAVIRYWLKEHSFVRCGKTKSFSFNEFIAINIQYLRSPFICLRDICKVLINRARFTKIM